MTAPTVTAHPLGGIVVEIPGLRLVSEANQRGHTRAKAKRVASQRSAITTTLRVMGGAVVPLPCRVVITRLAPRTLDDDNLASACKAVRDGVAEWLGIDDRDAQAEWSVAQEKGPCGVRVEIVSVRPFGGMSTSRITQEGVVRVVECVLGPKTTKVFAEAFAELARGERAEVVMNVGAVRLVVRAPDKETKT